MFFERQTLRAVRTGFLALVLLPSLGFSQGDRFKDVVVEANPVAPGVFMLTGAGGNIAVSAGPDGLLLVDDQFAPLAARIQTALEALPGGGPLTEVPLRYVINTHHHGDHTGSNAYFAGLGATLVASEPARVRLLAATGDPDAPLPVITYQEGVNIYFNGDRLRLLALRGHTDGDTAVFFETANVLHAGDLFFNGRFPYIDLGSAGGVDDYLRSQAAMLALVNDDTRIIPGHGPLATRADLRAVHQMIQATSAQVRTAIAQGQSLSAIQAVGVSEEFQGYAWAFIDVDRWLEILYRDGLRQSE